MKYKRTRFTTLVISYIATFTLAYLSIDDFDKPEVIALKFMVAAFGGLILALFAWGIVRVGIIEDMLDKTSGTESDIKKIADNAKLITLHKKMSYNELCASAQLVHDGVADQLTMRHHETFNFCISAILNQYSLLWKKDILCEDIEILNAIDKHYDKMKMVKYFSRDKS